MSEVQNAEIGINQSGADVPDPPNPLITQLFLDTFAIGLYEGLITEYQLSTELYASVGLYLQKALEKGYGDFETVIDFELFEELKRNLWHFAAAKQYQQNRTILKSFVAPLETVPFKDFKAVADPILDNYNKNWLKTEWATSVAESQAAREFNELMQDDAVEYIEYVTQEDDKVRHDHALLNGAIYPKGHSFWNKYFPPIDFNCRCFTVNHDSDTKPKVIKNPPDIKNFFNTNPAKDRIIFPNAHPYFRVAQGDKVFREANYGLPII